jgi:hypothetical protein
MINEFEWSEKEAVVAYFISEFLLKNWRKLQETLVRILGVRAKILIAHFPDTWKDYCYCLQHDQWKSLLNMFLYLTSSTFH